MVPLILFFLLLFMTTAFLLLKAVLVGKENITSLEFSILISFIAIMVSISIYLGAGDFITGIVQNSEGQLGKDLNKSIMEFINKKSP